MKHFALVVGVLTLLAPAPAAASIIEVEFSGLASGWFTTYDANLFPTLHGFSYGQFTATFVFNTELGVLTHTADGYRLEGSLLAGGGFATGAVSVDTGAGMTGGYGYSDWYRGPTNFLSWRDDLSVVSANAGATFHQASITTQGIGSGFYQSAGCPGGSCGQLRDVELVSFTIDGVPLAVPGPVVGSGLPALLLMAGAWLWRRQQKKPPGGDRAVFSNVGRLAPSD